MPEPTMLITDDSKAADTATADYREVVAAPLETVLPTLLLELNVPELS